jgi:hypothetical protein
MKPPGNGETKDEARSGPAMPTTVLSRIEQAIVQILERFPDDEIAGRELRGLLRNRGFRRSAPALVFTMMSLEDKGLITCREEVHVTDAVETKERYYTLLF